MSDPLLLVVVIGVLGVLGVLVVVLGLAVLRLRAELEDPRRQRPLSHGVPAAAAEPPPGMLTPPVDPASLPEVVDLVRRGQKISAIKALRVATGASLRDAKIAEPWHGQPASAEVTCPPLSVVWLRKAS